MKPPMVFRPAPAAVTDWPTTEAALYLGALDQCLSETADDSPRVVIAHRALRAAIVRDAPTMYARHPVDEGREAAWAEAMRDAVRALGADGVAALAWAAVDAWNDLGRAPWTRLAAAASRLGSALETPGTDNRVERLASALRAQMATAWRNGR